MLELRAKNEISGWLIVLNWFLLVILPVISFQVGSEWYFSGQFIENKAKIEPVLYSEMQSFSRDLDEKVLLTERFNQFDADQGFIDYKSMPGQKKIEKFMACEASKLHQRLEKMMGFPVFSVICHSVDTQEIDYYLKNKVEHGVKYSSKTMLKRMFSILNRQPHCQPVFPENYRPAFAREIDIDDGKIRDNYASGLLKKIFATIYKPPMKEREVYETAASRIGKTGNIFFYYGQARVKSKNGVYNLGGYIAAIRLQDIPESLIVKYAVSRSLNTRILRRTGFVNRALPFPDDFTAMNLNGYIQEKNRYALRVILPQIAMVRRIQRGTILPYDFSGFAEKTSMLEVSVKNHFLEHPWQKYRRIFDFLLKLYVLCGSMALIYIYLFNLNFKASISLKLSLASFFVCLVPVFSLYMLNSVYKYHSRAVFIEDLKAHLEAKNSLLQRSIDEEFEKYSQRTVDLAGLFEKSEGLPPDQLKVKLADWCAKNNAEGVILQNFNQRLLSYTNLDFADNKTKKQAWNLVHVLFSSLVEFLFTSPMVTQNPQQYSSLLTEGSNNAESVHRHLVDRGRLQIISRVFSDGRLSGCLVQREVEGQKKPVAFIAASYSAKKILEDYFAFGLSEFQFHEDFGRFALDTALFLRDGKKIKLVEKCYSKNFEAAQLLKEISNFSEVKGNSFFNRAENNKEAYYLVSSVNLAPYIVLIRGTFSRDDQTGLFDVGLAIYPIIVIVLTILLANLFFVAPGEEFSRLMNAIAEGRLDTRLKLATGDEFEKLSHDVNLMTKGLIEKEQLEKFVSPDVIKDVSLSTESEMRPGGEKIAATVVFASFDAFMKEAEAFGSEETVEQIDLFLGICNSICVNNHGVIDKIIGKTIMMVFRGVFAGKSHELRACQAMRQIVAAMHSQEVFACRCFAGLSSGQVVSGKIGSKTGKLDYTVIGDTVNMAARLKALAENKGESLIVLSKSVADAVKSEFEMIELEAVEVKGKAGQHRVWALF